MNYRCETDLAAIKDYLQNAAVVAFDFETAPLLQYRDDPRAALDAHRACIVGISLSVAEGSAIYIPLEHFDGGNADSDQVISFLRDALWTNPAVTKVAHNLAFESMFLYALGIIIQPPCYDTIAAAQMTLKNSFEFRGLSDSGLKKLVPELLGDELPEYRMPGFCIMTKRYLAGGGLTGAIGIVGPTRMPYRETIPRLEYFALLLGECMSGRVQEE